MSGGDGPWEAAGEAATPAAFNLGLCRLRGILFPPASGTIILQAAIHLADPMAMHAGLFSLQQRKLESVASCRCRKRP